MGLRSALYTIARLMGDVNAVKKGKVKNMDLLTGSIIAANMVNAL